MAFGVGCVLARTCVTWAMVRASTHPTLVKVMHFTSTIMNGETQVFKPKADLEDKLNYCRHIFIERDGSISEAVRLNVLDDRHREDIIGFHFSQQYAKMHYRDQHEQPQFYVVGRDCPWDFKYFLHDKSEFFLEICRVADSALLKAIKAENDVAPFLRKQLLKGYEILKFEKHFPGTFPARIVEKIVTKTYKQKEFQVQRDIVENGPRLFLRPPMIPTVNLVDEIMNAISKKVKKNHQGKEITTLLLDNLTTHANPKDFFDAVKALEDYLEKVPFPSIWLYTGYYSDDDGYNCEYSLVPIKLSDREISALIL